MEQPSGHTDMLLPLDASALHGGEHDKVGVGRMGGAATTDPYTTQGSNPRLADPSLLLTRMSLALDS